MTIDRILLTRITIPAYIREVQLSKAQREKYYEWDGITIKCKSKKLLQKYINPIYKSNIILNNGNIKIQYLKNKYCIVGFKGKYIASVINQDEIEQKFVLTENQHKKPIKYILCEKVEDGIKTYSIQYKKVIANETQVGKPRIQVINGQNIYNHTASPFTTGKIFDAIKDMYYKKLKSIPLSTRNKIKATLNESYPLQIEVEIRDTVKNFYDNTKEGNGRIWDVGNRADPYMKTFLDFFTKGLNDLEPFIEEDDRLHVTSGNNAHFTPIEDYEIPKLVFYIYKDNRKVFNKYLKNE